MLPRHNGPHLSARGRKATPTYFPEAVMLFGIPFGTYLAVGSALIAVGRIIVELLPLLR